MKQAYRNVVFGGEQGNWVGRCLLFSPLTFSVNAIQLNATGRVQLSPPSTFHPRLTSPDLPASQQHIGYFISPLVVPTAFHGVTSGRRARPVL